MSCILTALVVAFTGWFNPAQLSPELRMLPEAQFIADMSDGRYARSDSLAAAAFGASAIDTVVITDTAGRRTVLPMARYFPAGTEVRQLELAPSGSKLYVTTSTPTERGMPDVQVLVTDLTDGPDHLRFANAIARNFWSAPQYDADIDTHGDVYFVHQGTNSLFGDAGYLGRASGPDFFLLTDIGWMQVGDCLRTTVHDELLQDGRVVGRLVIGRKPVVAYDAAGEPAGLFFEAPRATGDASGTIVPNVHFADGRGRTLAIVVQGYAEANGSRGTPIDEFLHRAWENGRPVAGFLHKGPVYVAAEGVSGHGEYVLVALDDATAEGYRLHLQHIPTHANRSSHTPEGGWR